MTVFVRITVWILCLVRFVTTTRRSFGAATSLGLTNLGQTCYMNSVVQSLYYVDTFKYSLLNSDVHFEIKRKGKSKIKVNHKIIESTSQGINGIEARSVPFSATQATSATTTATATAPNSSTGTVLAALQSIFKQKYTFELQQGAVDSAEATSISAAISTEDLVCRSMFHSGRQEDAHEFFLKLMNDLNKRDGLSGGDADAEGGDIVAANSAREILTTTEEQYIHCLYVPYRSTRLTHHFGLSLDIIGHSTLHNALDAYFQPELLAHATGNPYRRTSAVPELGERAAAVKETNKQNDETISSSSSLQDAYKGVNLCGPLPAALVVHLKRFTFDLSDGNLKKVGSKLNFPYALRLARTTTSQNGGKRKEAEATLGNEEQGKESGGERRYHFVQTNDDGVDVTESESTFPDLDEQQELQQQQQQQQHIFRLKSVVLHAGDLDSGHYVCLARDSSSQRHGGGSGTCRSNRIHAPAFPDVQTVTSTPAQRVYKKARSEKACETDKDIEEDDKQEQEEQGWLLLDDSKVSRISAHDVMVLARGGSISDQLLEMRDPGILRQIFSGTGIRLPSSALNKRHKRYVHSSTPSETRQSSSEEIISTASVGAYMLFYEEQEEQEKQEK